MISMMLRLAFSPWRGVTFIVYQLDVKSAFLYGTIKDEVYVCQPPSFEDPQFPDKVYTVEKALYGLHQDPRAWYETLPTYLLENRFRRGTIDKTLFIKKDKGDILLVQVKQKDDGIFISQDKYVADILKKFGFVTVQTARTPIETNKALLKDEEAKDVGVHLYKSMIGSSMYLIACRPDILFAVCACASFQVTPKVSHLHAVKMIFRYLKGQPKLGLWYPRDLPFDLEAFSDSDYAGASLDRKSTTGAEYVAAANCCGQVLWIQNQMLDYGFNFMNTKIHIDNESTICIVKNPATEGNDDFHQIVNFLNASTIRYSLTISPTIYASYIEQFWATAKSKIVNNETQIHAKVDGKTIVISESLVRSNLHFKNEVGVASLTNSKILENLALMGYEIVSDKLTFQKAFFSHQWKYLIHTILPCLSSKSTAWNEFSTNIASAIICLANNQKFNFYKLIFDEPFNHTYETPKHTQKVFANMRRKGKSFSGTVTPLFASMLVPQVVEGEGSRQPSEPQPPPSTALSSQEGQVSAVAPSHPQKTQTPRQAKRGQDTEIPQSGGPPEKVGDEAVHKELGDRVERVATTTAGLDAEQDSGNILKTQSTAIPNVLLSREIGTSGGNTPGSDEERLEQHELTDNVPPTPHDSPLSGGHTPGSNEGRLKQVKLTDIVTALSQKVEGLESDLKKTKKLYATTFKKLINRVKSLEDELKFQKSKSKRRRLTLVTSEDEEDLLPEDPSKQGRSLIEEMDLNGGISLVPPHDEVQGRYGQNLET
ncbi:putative ribonuclease H-like domain-containing protein [Tanacetum coccineum]